MMTRQTVDVYLDRLSKELADLPDDRRRELIEEIRGHITEALSSMTDPSKAILLLTSGVWSRNDKVLGLLLFPGGLAFPLLLLNLVGEVCMSSTVDRRTTQSCTGTSLPPVLGIPLLIVLVVTPLVVAAHLASKLRTRS